MKSTELQSSEPAKRILVAEDDPLVAQTIRMVLTVDGHVVEVAKNGEEALAKFKTVKPDLVITEFKMERMDGLELAEAIKRLSSKTPIILVTAYEENIKTGMGNISNVDIVLGKPFSIAELQAALNKIFGRA